MISLDSFRDGSAELIAYASLGLFHYFAILSEARFYDLLAIFPPFCVVIRDRTLFSLPLPL